MKKRRRNHGAVMVSILLACMVFVLPVSAAETIIPVQQIVGIPQVVEPVRGGTLLSGEVQPHDASNKTILWSVRDSGGTGAECINNVLYAPVGGTIVVRASIQNGMAEGSDYVQDFVIRVEKNDVEKLAIANAAVSSALNGFTASNSTTKQDINNLLNTAIANTGVTYVSVSWSSNNDFSKVEATKDTNGYIRGQIDLICRNSFSSIPLNKVISMLAKPESNSPDKGKGEVKNDKEVNTVLGIKINQDISTLKEVYINGKLIEKKNYTINKENKNIVFVEAFLKTLGKGSYEVLIRFTDGEITSSFTLDDSGSIDKIEKEPLKTKANATKSNKKELLSKKENNKKNTTTLQIFVGILAVSGVALFYGMKKL